MLLKTPCGRRTAAPLSFLNSACRGEHVLQNHSEPWHILGHFRSQKRSFGTIFVSLWDHFEGPGAFLAAMGAGLEP